MPTIDDIVRGIGRGFGHAANAYANNPKINATVNTGLIYTGIKSAAYFAGLNDSELTAALDLSAPVVTALYANHRINQDAVVSQRHRGFWKVIIGGLVGYDMADTLMSKGPDSYAAVEYLKDHYHTASRAIARKFDISPTGFGAMLGAGFPLLKWVREGYLHARGISGPSTTP